MLGVCECLCKVVGEPVLSAMSPHGLKAFRLSDPNNLEGVSVLPHRTEEGVAPPSSFQSRSVPHQDFCFLSSPFCLPRHMYCRFG